MSQNS